MNLSYFTFYTAISFIIVVCFTFVVDPHNVSPISNHSIIKYRQFSESIGLERISKPYMFNKLKYEGVILGSSRSDQGLNPNSIKIKKFYNLSLPSITYQELGTLYQLAITNDSLSSIIFNIDFFPFTIRDKIKTEPINSVRFSTFPKNVVYSGDWRTALFSLNTLGKAIKTIADNVQNKKCLKSSYCSSNHGFRTMDVKKNNFRKKFLENYHYYSKKKQILDKAALDKFLQNIKYNPNITQYFYFSPTHISYLKSLYNSKSLNDFLKFRLYFCESILKLKLNLFDFAQPSFVTNEQIPKETNKKMIYFRDTNHFLPNVGDKIIKKILSTNYKKSNFGSYINNCKQIKENNILIREQIEQLSYTSN